VETRTSREEPCSKHCGSIKEKQWSC